MREQRAAMEKEVGSMQAKAQGSYQELQTMQIKVRPLITCRSMEFNSLVHSINSNSSCIQSILWEKHFSKDCMETESCCCVVQFQQVREQLESQITRLQQENGILRDAVSSATNQMESKSVLHSIDKTLLVMLTCLIHVSSVQCDETLRGCVNLIFSVID